MTTFESSIRVIQAPQERVFQTLSNLENLNKIIDNIPEDKRQDLTFDADSFAVTVAPIGKISMRIVERDAPKTIKMEAQESPMPFNFWIQLLPVTDETCKMKLTLKAEMNPFIKTMVQKPLQEAIEKMADTIQMIPF